MLHIEERNSFYSLLKKYERNMLNHNIRTESKSKLRKLIRDEFNTLWKTQVSSFPKADTYNKFKNRVKFESYLSDIKNRKYRVTFTKFRLSDHGLMIEKGRHKRPKNNVSVLFALRKSKIKATFSCNVFYMKIEMNYLWQLKPKHQTLLT